MTETPKLVLSGPSPDGEARFQSFIDGLLNDAGCGFQVDQGLMGHPKMWTFVDPGNPNKGVVAEIGFFNGEVMLSGLFTVPGSRRQGYANRVLTLICAHADRAGIAIELTIDPFARDEPDTPGVQELRTWYQKFGFVGVSRPLDRRMRRANKI